MAPGRAIPSRDTGQTNVLSSATTAPCHSGRPLANTSTRRQSASSKPMVTQENITSDSSACFAADSRGCPFQRRGVRPQHSGGRACRAMVGGGRRMQSLERRNPGTGGRATTARGPPGPDCDNRRARDAGSRSRKKLSSAVLSKLNTAIPGVDHQIRGRPSGGRPARQGRLLPTAAGRNPALAGGMAP